jgi:uncharacterized integral membrane protein (TIGR00698 family)
MNFIVPLLLISVAIFKIAPQWSILIGVATALILSPSTNTSKKSKEWSGRILQWSIVLLGSALNFNIVIKQGAQGAFLTLVSISLVLLIGEALSRVLKVESPLSVLISVGTAICGGSAIGAVSPVIRADAFSMAISLGLVFILNALSVFIFPPLGHLFEMTQVQFGTWSALAIHDTSSVVAASGIYGEEALKVGTTLKLTRALWILPLSISLSYVKKSDGKFAIPWFIFLFLANSLIFTFVGSMGFLIPYFSQLSKIGFSLTLFLIGISLNKEQLKRLKLKPVLYAVLLWLITLSGSLYYTLNFVI